MFRLTLFIFLLLNTTAFAQELFTKNDLQKISPRAQNDLIQTLLGNQNILLQADVNTRIRVAHFLSQIMLETGGLRRIDENMNYSAGRLREVFGRRVSQSKAEQLQNKPQEIANWVYGDRLGNLGKHTNDGWNYRGSGYIQLTGRDNFKRRGQEVGMSLVEQPELARTPIPGLKVAAAYWKARNINFAADQNDRLRVRKLVNGPSALHYKEGVLWFNRIWTKVYQNKAAFGTETAWLESEGEIESNNSNELVSEILNEKGFLDTNTFESFPNDEEFEEALKKYQKANGLEESGVLDDDTFYAITDPEQWKETDTVGVVDKPKLDSSSSNFTIDKDSSSSVVFENSELLPTQSDGSGVSTDDTLGITKSLEFAEAKTEYAKYEIATGKAGRGKNFIPFTIIGEDERTPITNTLLFPSRAIVQITYKKKGSERLNLCSGVMISKDTVLTAGHCLHGGTELGEWYQEFSVYPGKNNLSTPFGECAAKKAFALLGWTGSESIFVARDYDLGALKLDCLVGEQTGWFEMTSDIESISKEEIIVQGYPGDKIPRGRQWKSQDRVQEVRELKLFYKNDTAGGMSGSPVFTPNERLVNCIHTNGLHGEYPWNTYNACTRITNDRLNTINSWIQNQ